MRCRFVLTSKAQRSLKKIPLNIAVKIRRKIRHFLSVDNPMVFAKPLINLPPATHRFRVGKYRVKFFQRKGVFYITGIDLRKRVYK